MFDGGDNYGSDSGAFLGKSSIDTTVLDNTSIESDDGDAFPVSISSTAAAFPLVLVVAMVMTMMVSIH